MSAIPIPVRIVVGSLAALVTIAGCAGAEPQARRSAPPTRSATSVVTNPAEPREPKVGVSAVAAPDVANRCATTRADQRVVVSLNAQRAWLCHRGGTVRTFPITSGRTTPTTRTPTGSFRIQGRNRNSVLTLSDGRRYDVKFWIPFRAPDFGFHDAPWQHIPFGSPRYRTRGSHGCIHLALRDIRFLYHWVRIGTRVTITRS